jgi:hypothetical protein
MKPVRTALFIVHAVVLAIGGLFALLAVFSAFNTASYDALAVVLSKFALAAFLVAVSVAFVAALAVRGFTPTAPLLFVLSYALGGVVVGPNAHSMAKGFAPFEPQPLDYAMAVGSIVIACGLAIAAVVATIRWSRFPLT